MWDDEDTQRWHADEGLLEAARGPGDGSKLRKLPGSVAAPPPLPQAARAPASPPELAAPIAFAPSETIRAVYDAFVKRIGPAAKVLFAEELRAIGATPSRVPLAAVRDLVMLLAHHIPSGPIREAFVDEAVAQHAYGRIA